MKLKFITLICVMSAQICTAHASDKLVPVDAFVEPQQFTIPRLSPDGKHIAINVRIKRGIRTVPTITVYSLPDLKIVAVHALPGFEVPVNFNWISNDRLVIAKGEEVGYREPIQPTGELIASNLDGTKVEYLYGYKNFYQSSRGNRYGNDYGAGVVTHLPKSKDGQLFVSTHEWRRPRTNLYEINSFNGTRKLVADIGVRDLDFVHQSNGKVRFASGTDVDNHPILYRLDDASNQWQMLDSKNLGVEFEPFAFSNDDKMFFAHYSGDGSPSGVVRENLQTGERTVLAQDKLGNIDFIEYTADKIPFAVTFATGVPKPHYIDATLPDAILHKTLMNAFPGSYVHFINFSDDGKKLLFSVGSDRDPGSFYIFDKVAGKADILFTNMPQIEPDEMAERKPVTYTSRDGTMITGYLTMPPNSGKKKLPLVLLPHGGPVGIKDSWFFDPDAQFLASRGYAVLQVNFRGSGGRGYNFRKSGYREFGGKMITDLIDGVKWANQLPDIDGNRVCVYGASYGGYAAMMLPVNEPNMFKCSVGYSGLYDLVGRYKQNGIKGETQVTNLLSTIMGEDMTVLANTSPINLANKIKLPVFMVHGDQDKRTELGQAEVMRDALKQSGNEPEWILVKNEGHGFYDSEHRKMFYEKLEIFLQKHIGK